MSFDGGMIRACVWEMQPLVGAKIEKVLMPQKDEVVLLLHAKSGSVRLSISASAAAPRINITEIVKENPQTPPPVCMQLRKQLSGARITGIEQMGFDRVVSISLSAYDELGFPETKKLVAEIMGKYSNVILLSEKDRIIAALKTVDFTESRKRQLIPGMLYEAPPAQEKKDPLTETAEGFLSAAYAAAASGAAVGRYFCNTYAGISPLVSRELALSATGSLDTEIMEEAVPTLLSAFEAYQSRLLSNDYVPTIVYSAEGGEKKPLEFSFMPITQYGAGFPAEQVSSVSALIDLFYAEKERTERLRARGQDILRLLSAAKTRLLKKTAAQKEDLRLCGEKEEYKRLGDLITANLYCLKRGIKSATLTDYTVDPPAEVAVTLDGTLSPAGNAQKFYKKYAKLKTAETELAKQLALTEKELLYIETVFEAFSRSETEADLLDLREELYHSGYASKMKNYRTQKNVKNKPLSFRTGNGYLVYIGKNNVQNDHLSFKQAERHDYWFHVKNAPGSHVILVTEGEEPPAEDFTEAAAAAAYYSSLRAGERVEVDYTPVRNLKKPAGAKPGFVIYHTNYSAVVTPKKPETL